MNDPSKSSFVGRSILRREDRRLLTGRGQFIADLDLPRMLHAVFVRSPVAHARIRSVDLSRAAAAPGVAYVLSGAELARLLPPVPDTQLSLPSKWTTQVQHKFINPQQPLLAHDKVRHVGEAVAVIVAESRHAAEDAAQLVSLDLDPLPAVVDPEQALRAGRTDHPRQVRDQPDRRLHHRQGRLRRRARALAAQAASAAFIITATPPRRWNAAASSAPMTRARTAVTIWSSTQVVHWVRREAAAVLRLPEARIRCVALDVGGGFGVKGHVYPEDLLIPFLARRLGRPVQWIEDRREHLMCSCHSRDQIHDVEVGFDDDGRILALRDDFIVDCGAWNPIGAGVVYNTAVHLTGPYKIDALAISARIAATNKVPNAPYRGAGRPEAAFAMERVIDLVAGALGLEPAEVRLRNMIRADEMPYRVGIPYRDGEPIVYDGGDYQGALRKALAAIGGVEAFRARQRAARDDGRHLGLGIGCYVEGTGVGPFESAIGADRSVGQDLRVGRRLPAGPGHGDDLRAGRGRRLVGRARRRGHVARRHRGDRDRVRHHRQPQHRDLVGGHSRRERAAAREGLRHRRQSAGMRRRRPRAAQGRRRHRRRAGRRGVARQGGAGGASGLGSRPPARHRRRTGGDLLLRAADGHLVLCRACGDRRGRYRARAREHREIRHRA